MHPKLGLAIAMPYDADTSVINNTALAKSTRKRSSRPKGHHSDHLLYNIVQTEKQIDNGFDGDVYVVESSATA